MKLIIEGGKFTGKSTVVRCLNEIYRDASVFEFRASLVDSSFHRFTVHESVEAILLSFIEFLTMIRSSNQIHLRGHLFPIVVSKVSSQELDYDFKMIDRLFYDLGYKLVLLTTNKTEYNKRVQERNTKGLKIKEWDSQWLNAWRVQNAYEIYFEMSRLDKLKIDNSGMTSDECCEQIKNWLSSLSDF